MYDFWTISFFGLLLFSCEIVDYIFGMSIVNFNNKLEKKLKCHVRYQTFRT